MVIIAAIWYVSICSIILSQSLEICVHNQKAKGLVNLNKGSYLHIQLSRFLKPLRTYCSTLTLVLGSDGLASLKNKLECEIDL